MKQKYFITLSLSIFLCFCNPLYAQKAKAKASPKPKPKIVEKKVDIPDDFKGIIDLLREGKITLYEAYNSQVDIINKIQKNTFNKQLLDEESNTDFIIQPVEESLIFDYQNKSFAYIFSTKSKVNNYMIIKDIVPKISLLSCTEITISKKKYGEVNILFLPLPKETIYVTLDNQNNIVHNNQNIDVAMFFFPANDIQSQEKLLNAFKNMIMLANLDFTDSDAINKIIQVTTSEEEDRTLIVFKKES